MTTPVSEHKVSPEARMLIGAVVQSSKVLARNETSTSALRVAAIDYRALTEYIARLENRAADSARGAPHER